MLDRLRNFFNTYKQSAWTTDITLSLLLMVFYYRSLLTAGISAHLLDQFDQKSFIWSLEWLHHSTFGTGELTNLLNTNIFYPHKGTGAWSDMILGFIPLYSFFRFFTDNLVLCLNSIALSLLFLSCLGVMRIGRLITGNVSIVAPVIGCIGLVTAGQEGHIQMKSAAIVAWMAVAAIKYSQTLAPRYLTITFVLWTVLFHSSIYLFLMTTYLSLLLILVCLATHPKETFAWLRTALHKVFRPSVLLCCSAAFTTVVLALLKYLQAKELQGTYSLEEAVVFSGRILSLLDAPPTSFLYKSLYSDWGSHEAKLMVGILALFLAAASLLIPSASSECTSVPRRILSIVIWLAIICFTLALGPYEKISFLNGTHIPMPGWIFWSYLPGFSAMRVAGRFATIGVLAIAILSEVGFKRILAIAESKCTRKVIGTVTVGLLVLEQSSFIPTFPTKLIVYPKFYSSIDHQLPLNAVLVELPLILPNHFENISWFLEQELSSTLHWRRLLIGYSSKTSPELSQAIGLWNSGLADTSQMVTFLDYLNGLHVTHLVLNTDLLSTPVLNATRQYVQSKGASEPTFHRKNKEVWVLNELSSDS